LNDEAKQIKESGGLYAEDLSLAETPVEAENKPATVSAHSQPPRRWSITGGRQTIARASARVEGDQAARGGCAQSANRPPIEKWVYRLIGVCIFEFGATLIEGAREHKE
jgi:hypothetical protein